MKGSKLHKAFSEMAENLQVIAKELPKEIDKMKDTISPEEMSKVSDIMNKTGFESKVKEMEKAKKELDKILKDA